MVLTPSHDRNGKGLYLGTTVENKILKTDFPSYSVEKIRLHSTEHFVYNVELTQILNYYNAYRSTLTRITAL
jgi:hypothetical protein